jgi:hypothetical protein
MGALSGIYDPFLSWTFGIGKVSESECVLGVQIDFGVETLMIADV